MSPPNFSVLDFHRNSFFALAIFIRAPWSFSTFPWTRTGGKLIIVYSGIGSLLFFKFYYLT